MTDYVEGLTKRRDKDYLNKMTNEERKAWARQILKRMAAAWNVKGNPGIARLIGCHPKMPNNWVRDQSIPFNVIYTCHLATGASLDWLYNGVVPEEVSAEEVSAEVVDIEERRDEIRATIDTVLNMSVDLKLLAVSTPDGNNICATALTDKLVKLLTNKIV